MKTQKKKRVLIVDDDTSVRESLGRVLQGSGYDVLQAADGLQAERLFQSDPVDLLLLDIGLPVKSGWETFERITRRNPALPIIIITGHTGQQETALAAGVGALMEKPLDVSRLLQTIQELLAEPAEDRLRRLIGLRQDVRFVRPASSRTL